MSGNDLARTGIAFLEELEKFNQHLLVNFELNEETKDNLSSIWNDTVREEFEKIWQPLQEQMRDYIHIVGPNHVDTLKPRLEALIQYLNKKA